MTGRGRIDLVLVAVVLVLLALGVQMVYSSSFLVARAEFGDDWYFMTRQLAWIALGLALLGITAALDFRVWKPFSSALLVASIIALVLVLVPQLADNRYGSSRWLKMGPLPSVQPSEFAKLALVLYLANWLPAKGQWVSRFKSGAAPFLIVVGLISVLVMLEPDMGTTFIICATAFSVFVVAGANLWHLVFAIVPGGIAVGIWAIIVEPYRFRRFLGWWDYESDIAGKGWQTYQTLVALGSGGVSGVGLGMSRQKAFYLPNAHTDSILAIIGEELGFVGTCAVILLFALIGWRGMRIAARSADPVARLLAVGLTSKIIWQTIVNIGAVTNSLPYTGVTLPFISSGGSSLCISLASIGILLSVSREATGDRPRVERPTKDSGPTRQKPVRRRGGVARAPAGGVAHA
ncbi:MAG: putative lipid II flippase FtsW [Chloroflexota bacterium]